jgi:hypothetical protein
MPLVRWLSTTAMLTPLLLGMAACTPERVTVLAASAMPTAQQAGITVGIPRITRSTDWIGVDLRIRNTTASQLALARYKDHFTSVRLMRGSTTIVGYKPQLVYRTLLSERYTVSPGDERILHIDFAAAGIDTATNLAIQVDGRVQGQTITWRLPLPATGAEPIAQR